MWVEKNKVIARRFRRDLWNSGDLALADEIIDRDCIVHARIPFATDFTSGPEALKQLVGFFHMTFSEIEMKVEQVVAEDDMVTVRWSGRGRHTGNLFGVAPTGRRIATTGIDMLRLAGGRIVEGWVIWDVLSLMEQILARPGEDTEADFLSLVAKLRDPSPGSDEP